MARARLSPQAANAVKSLAKVATSIVTELANRFEQELEVRLSIESDVAAVVEAHDGCAGLPQDERSALVESVLGLHFSWAASGRARSEYLDDLLAAYAEIAGELPEQFRANCEVILGVRALRASAKAMILYSDYDRVLVSSRIFTDLRPVFDDDLDGPLVASLITHTLKLGINRDGRHEDLYLALDADDLNRLQEAITRALAKAKTLARAVRESPNQTLGATMENHSND